MASEYFSWSYDTGVSAILRGFLSDLLSFEGVNNFEIKIKIKFGEFPVYLEDQVFETFQLNIWNFNEF